MGICCIQLVHALVIMLGPITFGTILCYPSPTASEIQAHHGLKDDAIQWSFYNSVSSLFAIAGPFVTTGILKWMQQSRKKTCFVIACFGVAFWLLNLLTKVNIWAGIIIRAILGIVMGAYSSIAPLYLVEIAPADVSGFFGCLNQIGIVLGIVFFDFIGPSLTYMTLNYVGAAVCGLQAILIWFIEESPVVEELLRQQEKEAQANEEPRKKDSLWQKKYAFGLCSGILMMFFQQFSGINAILTNLADLMDESGLELDGSYQGGIATCAQLIAVFVGGLIMDKLGRKLVWIISCSIIIVFILIYALNVKFDWSTVLPLICIFLYQLGFGLGEGPIPWFIIPEYFNDDVRPLATTIVSASNWVFAFIVILVWPSMKKGMGMFGALIFFMFVSVASLLFGIFCIHEPKKKDEANKDELKKEDEESSSSDQPESL